MRKMISSLVVAAMVLVFAIFYAENKKEQNAQKIEEEARKAEQQEQERIEGERKAAFDYIKAKADSAKVYSSKMGFSIEHCFLLDFKIHSGKDRFFVWSFEKDTVLLASICCHGSGRGSTPDTPVFSNEIGSHCSSLGRFRVGLRSGYKWGANVYYDLHGLDKTNSNALVRRTGLHSYQGVSETETYPRSTPLGWSEGCPIISDNKMRTVDTLIQKTKKPILLWSYN